MSEEIIKVTEIQSIVSKAPALLAENEASHKKAIEYGKTLIADANKNGMSADMNDLLGQYLDKLDKTAKLMLERRKPFTQIMDYLKKKFTALESELGKDSEIVIAVRALRDGFATQQTNLQRAKEAEALAKLEKEKEAVQIAKDWEIRSNNIYYEILNNEKLRMLNVLNDSTLQTIDKVESVLNTIETTIKKDENIINVDCMALCNEYKYHTSDEIKKIRESVDTKKIFADFAIIYEKDINLQRLELIDKIPTKKTQLLEAAAAQKAIDEAKDADEKAKAEKEKRKQEEAEALRVNEEERKLISETNEQIEKKQQAVNVKAAGHTAAVTTATLAELFVPVPDAKVQYKLIINENAGYAQVFQFWFEKQGKKLPREKIEKFTITRMIKFVEDNEEKIVSDFVSYKEVIKAK